MAAKTKKQNSKTSRSVHKHRPKGVSAKTFERVYWPYLPIMLIIGVLLFFSGQSGALQAGLRNPSGSVLAYATSMSSSGLLNATNSERAGAGSKSLTINSKLASAAQAKADDMANRNYWSHNTPEGDPPWVFITAKGYKYQKLGENLAAGFSNESATVAGWMASPSHKDNMLDPAFSEVGFGWANNSNYTSAGGGPMTIVVAMYGKPAVLSTQTGTTSSGSNQKPVTKKPTSTVKKIETKKTEPPKKEAPNNQESKEIVDQIDTTLQQPLNNEGLTVGTGFVAKTSYIQSLMGNMPASGLAGGLAIASALAIIGIWVSRHALAVRRAVIAGESFALHHPMVDIGLIIIAALLYLLSRTSGMVQ